LQAQHQRLTADRIHIENIIYNLLDNAVKYSDRIPEIKISTRNERDGIVISITDKGIGMTPDQKKKIFEKFYRIPQGNLHNNPSNSDSPTIGCHKNPFFVLVLLIFRATSTDRR